LGIGWDASSLPAGAFREFERQAGAILRKLQGHEPWVMKDNRLAFTAPLWLEMLRPSRTLCLLTYRHPARTAARLAQKGYWKQVAAKLDGQVSGAADGWAG